jgi:nucleotide-binding universal stress UspA family protein
MKILFVTDGFEAAERARDLLVRMADKERSEITVLSVTHRGLPAPEHFLVSLDPIEGRREDSVKLVDASVEFFREAGFNAQGRTAEGHPGDEIVRAVEDDWYEMTVMGAGGRSWLGHLLLGSVSTYVLHSSPSSVLIVHESSEVSPMRVLLGTDGSRGSERAVQDLAGFASRERCEVTALAVAPSPPMVLPFPGSARAIDPAVETKLKHEMLARAKDHATHAADELRTAGFRADARTVVGHATEQLLKEADGGNFQLVAVGSQGAGPVRRSLLRSVSDQVVRHARATLVARRLVQ